MNMTEETLKKLQAADDVLRCDGPADLDWKQYEESVRRLKPELERFLNIPLFLLDGVQDASFVADICSEDRIFCLRFSAWGNFFTIWDESSQNPLSTNEFEPVITLIQKRGFVHINYDDLGESYEGQNEHYKKETWDRLRDGVIRKEKASWWVRYFDYT